MPNIELGQNIVYVALVVGVANIGLLLGLLHSYWKTYKEVKSGFTIGLLYFTSVLILQNIVSTIFLVFTLIMPIEFHGPEIGGPTLPLLLINIVQLIALTILFKITRE
jgi:hypothetical protein